MGVTLIQAGVRLFGHPFIRFIGKKLAFYVAVAFIALNVIFFLPRLLPGDPVEHFIPPGIPETGARQIREFYTSYLGLDKPLYMQYADFWVNLLHGDLGMATMKNYQFMPVTDVVMSRLPYTLALVVPALVISFFLGNWIGARAAYMKGKRSAAVYFTSVFASTLPFYWFGMILQFLLAYKFRIFPLYGTFSLGNIPAINLYTLLDALSHYALPFLTLLIVATGGWATGMRSMTLYELDSGYILYGRQLGFRDKRLQAYAKRNAMLPQFTGLNINLNNYIGQTMILEMIFGWRGLGLLAWEAVFARDYGILLGTFLITLIIIIIGNFLIDISYALIDPRIRTGQGG